MNLISDEENSDKFCNEEEQFQLDIRSISLEIAKYEAETKKLEYTQRKKVGQPHFRYPTVIFYDPNEKKYRCELVNQFAALDFEEGEEDLPEWAESAKRQEIVAYGDTPQQACDNFDYIWVHGNVE